MYGSIGLPFSRNIWHEKLCVSKPHETKICQMLPFDINDKKFSKPMYLSQNKQCGKFANVFSHQICWLYSVIYTSKFNTTLNHM